MVKSDKIINLSQIGCGSWGRNLLRNFYKLSSVRFKCVAETARDGRHYVESNYKDVKVVDDYAKMLGDKDIDAVIVATPAADHYCQARDVLKAGKHCFVEKPLSIKTEEARELISIAEKNGKVLMVGHTFLYNSAVKRLKEEIDKGTLGKVYYIHSQRLNLGKIRTDINAMWNFAPHDVSICCYLIDSPPLWVSAEGASYIQPSIEDVIFLTMGFENGVVANMHISWLDPNKVRRMTVVGSKKMVVYDDVSDNKIMIFDKGIERMEINKSLGTFDDFGRFQLIHRAGDIFVPNIDFKEPLEVEAKHFIECVLENKKPLTDGANGLLITKILSAGSLSLARKGERVELS